MRKTGIVCASWFEAADVLPADEYKELFRAIAGFLFRDEEPPELPPVSRAIFTMVKPVVESNKEKWEARKETGRPALPVTAEEARKAVEKAGTVKAAADMLGVSLRTMYNRLGVQKCKNAKSGNDNSNDNMKVNNCKAIFAQSAKSAETANPPKPFDEALSELPSVSETGEAKPTEQEVEQVKEIFDRLPFRRPFAQAHEKGERIEETKEELQAQEQEPSPAGLAAFFEEMAEQARQQSEKAISESAQSLYEGEAEAYQDASQMLSNGLTDTIKKQLEWRKNRANIERSKDSEGLDYACHFEGQYQAYMQVSRIVARHETAGQGRSTVYNVCYVGQNAGGNGQTAIEA